mmetsp:Transcript_892/g.891  ORF Transcript_892/g.891 Transcript_892/m.891 type:complete len:288 (-) Transcript_892:186-1049(-)|eukprot:CAMPEP_0174822712 /NCGR_PEP_ID=MMETSP1107-20130205/17871_1 /TAXON_ID=36770 /ORGANISM="Paraphysomonas vestita, Strain GFlagA" /LENGTH=287 /DNA_ID=CAMNT_0016042463 /DNA_START=51 /DNA_END=914 /DNA_ORIENTATION=+
MTTPGSPSKRWVTTTGSSLEDVASKIGKYDRGQMVADLRSRKLANTKTSILFGNDKINYMSDAHSQQQNVMSGFDVEERKAQALRNKNMKTELTSTNFTLGDEKIDYDTTTKAGLRLAAEATQSGRNKATISVPAQKSSIDFGREVPSYKSVAQEAMAYHGNQTDFQQMKSEVAALKSNLRRHQISMGDAKIQYTTDYREKFQANPENCYDHGDRKAELRKVIEDTRKCHFSLGDDKPEYISNTHRSQEGVAGSSTDDMMKAKEHARKMKENLQKTSFVVGFDAEYA